MEVGFVRQIGIHWSAGDLGHSGLLVGLLRAGRGGLLDFLNSSLLLRRLLLFAGLWPVHLLLVFRLLLLFRLFRLPLLLLLLLLVLRLLLLVALGRLLRFAASWVVGLTCFLALVGLVLPLFRGDELLTGGPFREGLDQVVVLVLPDLRLELLGDVEQMGRIHDRSSVQLAVPVDVGALQELLVKEHNDLLLSLAHDCSTEAEGDVRSAARVQIHHSLAGLEHVRAVSAVHGKYTNK